MVQYGGSGLEEFKDVQSALVVLGGFRTNTTIAPRDNSAFQEALRREVVVGAASDDEVQARAGRLVNGFTNLCNVLLEQLATASGQTADNVFQAFERQTEENIRRAKR